MAAGCSRSKTSTYGLDQGAPSDELAPLYCLAVSAKRYVLFNLDEQGRPVIRKPSRAGLGHLEPPYSEERAPRTIPAPAQPLRKLGLQRWHYDLWYRIAAAALDGDPTAVKLDDLPGFNRPAMIAYTATTPNQLSWFDTYNNPKPYATRVRPFGFYQAPILADDGLPVGQHPDRFRLVCPYTKDQRQWGKRRYTNIYGPDQRSYAISTSLRTDTIARVTSYRELALDYVRHPEPKSLGPDGKPCSEPTRGELQPRHLRVDDLVHIGKESNEYDQLGLSSDDEVTTRYENAHHDQWATFVRPVLEHSARKTIAELTGLSPRAINDHIAGRAQPQPDTLERLTRAAATLAPPTPPKTRHRPAAKRPVSSQELHGRLVRRGPARLCEGGCGRRLDGPRKRLCDACKQRAYRARRRNQR